MFTGIIEEIGTVSASYDQERIHSTMLYHCRKVLSDVKKGDSISVNGVCLTVSEFSSDQFTADVMPETVKATTLQALAYGKLS